MNDQPVYLTAEGLAKAKDELTALRTQKRPEVVERLQAAQAMGDLRENADYQEAKDELARVDGRIGLLEDTLRRVQIIEAGAAERVAIGATVVVRTEDGKEKTYSIVGAAEADPAAGRISNESPIGKMLIGARVGDTVEVSLPAGATAFTVVSIS